MPCYKPLQAWQRSEGIKPVFKKPEDQWNYNPLKLPCGRCIGCRLERSRQWAVRCVHEASIHRENCFITLTYDNENVPTDHGLVKKDFQDFMKRFRKSIEPIQVKFYMCGEYGSVYAPEDHQRLNPLKDSEGRTLIGRPHYHACIFGYDFEDKKLWKTKRNIPLYRSDKLEKLWPKGYSTIGTVTFESAAYVARYVTKKINGELQEQISDSALRHYERATEDGEILKVIPEYTTMSRGGKKKGSHGIGYDWFEKYHSDVYMHDSVVLNGKEMQPPRYYQDIYQIHYPEKMEIIKTKRRQALQDKQHDYTPERLKQRLQVKQAQTKNLIREL